MPLALRSSLISLLAVFGLTGVGSTQTPAPPAAVLAALPAVKGVDGRWEGKLIAGDAALRIVFRINTDASGSHVALDSPDQGASGIPVSGLTHDGDRVTISVDVIGGRYSAKMAADGKAMAGSWSQGGNDLPLNLVRAPD